MPEAIMQRTYGKSNVLNIEKIYVNDPADDEILIKQTAIGIHFHDVYVRTGLYKTLKLPGIPGIEATGVVEKKGLNVNNLNIGDRVVYIKGSYGAYASHRVINHNIVAKIPNELDDATMATNFSRALTVNMLTEQVFNLKDKTTVLITAAAGGVGRLLCQYLNSIGKIVIGTVGSEEKIKVAKSWGCKEAFIYNDKKICEYSNLQANIFLPKIPISNRAKKFFRIIKTKEKDMWNKILFGGEDYNLLFSIKREKQAFLRKKLKNVHRIGSFKRGKGICFLDEKKTKIDFKNIGFSHF